MGAKTTLSPYVQETQPYSVMIDFTSVFTDKKTGTKRATPMRQSEAEKDRAPRIIARN